MNAVVMVSNFEPRHAHKAQRAVLHQAGRVKAAGFFICSSGFWNVGVDWSGWCWAASDLLLLKLTFVRTKLTFVGEESWYLHVVSLPVPR